MACLIGKGGYQSPAVGVWAYAIVIQLSLGIYMLFSFSIINDLEILYQTKCLAVFTFKTIFKLQYLAVFHIALSLVTTIPFLLGHLVCKWFLLPMCIFNYIQSLLCTATSSVCAYFLYTGGCSMLGQMSKIATLPDFLMSFVIENPDKYALDYRDKFFTSGIISIIAGFLYRRTASFKKSTDNLTSFLYTPTLAIGLALGFITIFPTMDKTLVIVGVILFLASFIAEILVSITQIRLMKVLTPVLLAMFGALTLASFFLVIYSIRILTSGRLDFTSYSGIISGKLKEFIDENNTTIKGYVDLELAKEIIDSNTTSISLETLNFILGNGCFSLCFVILGSAEAFLGVFCCFYALKDMLSCGVTSDKDNNNNNNN